MCGGEAGPGSAGVIVRHVTRATALALQDSSGRTPLALAIYLHHAACEALLRAHGATA